MVQKQVPRSDQEDVGARGQGSKLPGRSGRSQKGRECQK